MRPGGVVIAVLSLLVAAASLVAAVSSGQIVSPLGALGVVLIAYAAVRLALARRP